MLLAAGAVAIGGWLGRVRRPALATGLRVGMMALIVIALAVFVPIGTWMLSPQHYIAYTKAIGLAPKQVEVHHTGPLPQPMGDQFGWPELVAQVAGIYDSLPAEQRAETGILAGNYGEAGAVDLWGPKYGLPHAVSGHQNYWFWGPGTKQYDNFIVIQWSEDDVQKYCTSYRTFPHESEWGMGEENTPIYLCMGAKFDPRARWAEFNIGIRAGQ